MRTLQFKDDYKTIVLRDDTKTLKFEDKTKSLKFDAEMAYLLVAPKSYLLSETGKIRI